MTILTYQYVTKRLRTQLLLPMDLGFESPLRVISVNGTPELTFADFARGLVSDWVLSPLLTEQDFNQVKAEIDRAVFHLPDSKIAALFIDHLRLFGYRILGEIPWTETKALDLEYLMPLNVRQRGIALFLNKPQSYTLLTKKILDMSTWDFDPELPMLSDFVICLDFSNEQVALKYFERDLIIKKSQTSPTVVLLTRAHIRDMLLAMVLVMLADEYVLSMSGLPELKQRFHDVIQRWGLETQWSVAVKETAQKPAVS